MSNNSIISREDSGHDTEQASKLEATLGNISVPPRPMSLRQSAVFRHSEMTDQNVNELDFEYTLDPRRYPLTRLNSLQEVFGAVQYHQHLANDNNFSNATTVRCLLANHKSAREYIQDVGPWPISHGIIRHGVVGRYKASAYARCSSILNPTCNS